MPLRLYVFFSREQASDSGCQCRKPAVLIVACRRSAVGSLMAAEPLPSPAGGDGPTILELACTHLVGERLGSVDDCLEVAGFVAYFAWLVYPAMVIMFVLPAFILAFLYASALFLHVYKWRGRLRDAYSHDFWDGARQTLAALWDGQAKIWHGYEIVGLENIPDTGPALLVYYHGAIPIDMYYIMAKVLLHKNRQLQAIGDRFLFNVPGFRLLMEVFCVQPGTVRSCVDLMKQGHLLAVAPGGVREALFSDELYRLKWANRSGFARIAIESRAPVIPIFTENVREAFRALSVGRRYLRALYERTRLPLVPIYGGFPVKLRTFIGPPIVCQAGTTVEELTLKVRVTIERMISEHQRIPGSIVRALIERVLPRAVTERRRRRQRRSCTLAVDTTADCAAVGTGQSDTVDAATATQAVDDSPPLTAGCVESNG